MTTEMGAESALRTQRYEARQPSNPCLISPTEATRPQTTPRRGYQGHFPSDLGERRKLGAALLQRIGGQLY